MSGLATLDWAVVAAYFALTFGVAWWAWWREHHDRVPVSGVEDYFLANRNVGWFVVGASVFASNIGSEHLVGLAGSGAASGVAVAQFEIIASLALLLLGWLFAPFYLSSRVFTMPEFMERRFSRGPRTYLAAVSVLAYVLTKISVTIAAGGIVFETLMGIGFWTGAFVTVVATGLYTLWGGLRAVLYTDTTQMLIIIAGSVVLVFLGLDRVGGWGALTAAVEPGFMSLWKPSSHPDYPWTGILLGAPILAIWYWCTDQFIVQRVLSARNVSQARKAVLFAGYLKQLPLFIFVLPGIIAVVLAQRGELALERPDQALPALIGALLPTGLRGLMVAALLAALMSSLSSVFNSCATLITVDVFKRWRPGLSDRQLVTIGHVSVAAMVLLGLLWIPFIDVISGQLYTYLQSVQAYLSPPIACVFLLGVLWPRANARGAAAALAVGAVLGLSRLVLEAMQVRADGLLGLLVGSNFLHFAFALFVLSVVVMGVVSVLTAPPPRENIEGLVLGQEIVADVAPLEREHRGVEIALSVGVVALVGLVWWYFS
jgi:SSS family solute:Na+ symporter